MLRTMEIHWRDWSSDTPWVNLSFGKLTQLSQYAAVLQMDRIEAKMESKNG